MRFRTALLSMALGLLAVGFACGEDESTGNWLTHMFNPAAKPAPEPAKIETKNVDPPVLSSRERRRDAEKAYMRRLEAIQMLYTLADQLNDAELRRTAEALDQRNFDVYKAACGPTRVPDREVVSAGDKNPKESR